MKRMTLEVLNAVLVKPWWSEMSWHSLQGTEWDFKSCQSTVTLGRVGSYMEDRWTDASGDEAEVRGSL